MTKQKDQKLMSETFEEANIRDAEQSLLDVADLHARQLISNYRTAIEAAAVAKIRNAADNISNIAVRNGMHAAADLIYDERPETDE